MQRREFIPTAGKKKRKIHATTSSEVTTVSENTVSQAPTGAVDIHIQKQQQEQERTKSTTQGTSEVKSKKSGKKTAFEVADAPTLVKSRGGRYERSFGKSEEKKQDIDDLVASMISNQTGSSQYVREPKRRGALKEGTIEDEQATGEQDTDEEILPESAKSEDDHITNFHKHFVPISLSVAKEKPKSHKEAKTFTPGETLKEEFEKSSSSQKTKLLLFQIPAVLPMQLVTNELEVTGNDNRFSVSTLAQCGNGRIGTLQIRKSGKAQLVLGKCGRGNHKEFVMDVNPSCEFDCFQEVMSLKAHHTTDLVEVVSTCTVVGEVQPKDFYVCSYPPTQLL
ncbi:hypothetical protein RFI_19290 [Reticulomyxa filosa]|uniref:Uncharacterized protein n=1 Tax=Reticulomyxa filosa TaxID=46433 RepID=X6MWJ1_RETFI|nr:hypothetical protein RFI_19290 [Reticulomyxa filosa]|eukprot:ETO18001.1 hypothetical protein RFI_19290 [Reticulomyxa filosa]